MTPAPVTSDERRKRGERHSVAPSISDIVLDPKYYSTILAARPAEVSSTNEQTTDSPVSVQREARSPPKDINSTTSIVELVLNNVTYDAILASSTKALANDSESESSPPPLQYPSFDNLRTPPNSPSTGTMGSGYISLMSTSATIMEPDVRKQD
ncbi:hypothetical protein Hypma_012217 [Hypsizygus marmoreus]|uniref:Uncharacterized protein n=1 Tax=Hypsizygus marmoreus TaxID=39966 RepID=A0A369JN20_HYPMA|nr:hypothetical protein Hypma_012217 [Hypsizygus marmoreus]